jgi:hypothetical protein
MIALYAADKLAHEEAVQNGGVGCSLLYFLLLDDSPCLCVFWQLILYWYGVPNPITGMNLATCIWQSRKHAIAGHSKPYHIRAMKLAQASFERYELERHVLRKVKGEMGVRVEEWGGGEVGW